MNDKKQELKNNLEDAYIALLMNDLSEEEGARLLEECEQLNTDPNAAVSESLHAKCMEVVSNHYARERNAQTKIRVQSRIKRVLLVAAIIAVLFTTAFAAIEEFRVGVLNFTLDVREKYSYIIFNKADDDSDKQGSSDSNSSIVCDRRLTINYDLSGFELVNEISDEMGVVANFSSEVSGQIVKIITTTITDNTISQVDTENADLVKDISINGAEGLLVVKGERNHLLWLNSEGTVLMQVVTIGLTSEQAIEVAEGIVYSEHE